jgi:excisionase family DNA binding protein
MLISAREAAATLGIGRDATYRLIREGRLPSIVVGRRILIPVSALASWVERELESTRPGA